MNANFEILEVLKKKRNSIIFVISRYIRTGKSSRDTQYNIILCYGCKIHCGNDDLNTG